MIRQLASRAWTWICDNPVAAIAVAQIALGYLAGHYASFGWAAGVVGALEIAKRQLVAPANPRRPRRPDELLSEHDQREMARLAERRAKPRD